MTRREAARRIAARLLDGERSVDRVKREECRRAGISHMIRNPEILAAVPEGRLTPEIRALLLKRPTRTLSGVTPVAVMVRPGGSCRWSCAYCPKAGLAAKSYTGHEPAALRARQFNFDPFLQASSRVRQLEEGGHPADKCEAIVMGGTFLEMPRAYRRSFIKGVYDGLNGFRSRTLKSAIRANEGARTHRVVGLTIETRPDVCLPYIHEMLSYGATRVELGVQHADDRIYSMINRGHSVGDVVDATRGLKDAAFKVLYHIMPGLPGSNRRRDISFVRRLFSDSRFRPDMLKIYPTLVLEGTALHAMQEAGEYEPYGAEEAADVISEFYRNIPPYVRVMRIQRDIPAGLIGAGVRKSNLRELVERRIREKGIVPREMRWREAGLQRKLPASDFSLRRLRYAASGGRETFISCENSEGLMAGFLRLRFPGESTCSVQAPAALVRELHVYGAEARLKKEGAIQHRGIGSALLAEAEGAARAAGFDEMLIISGVGVREYYRRRGYSLSGPYMRKVL